MRLKFDPGDSAGGEVEVGSGKTRVLVGRVDECDIQTANRTVSRRHCEFVYEGGVIRLRDLGSTSGTYVNGSKITSTVIERGDSIACGQLKITAIDESGGGGGGGASFDDFAGFAEPAETKGGGGGGEGGGAIGGLDAFFSSSPSPGGASSGDDDMWAIDEPVSRRKKKKSGGSETVKDKVPESMSGPAPSASPAAASEPAEVEPTVSAYELVYIDAGVGEGRYQIGPDTAPVILGRHADATIRVKNATVSRRHCKFTWADGSLAVADMGSSAGTFINGKRIKEGKATGGDMIVCGKLEVRLVPILEEVAPTSGRWTICYQDVEGHTFRHPVGAGHPPVTLGRSQAADLRLRDGTVGRKHCRIAWADGQLVVTDIGSRNGTFVNGERVTKAVLNPGDEVRCGNYPVRVEGPGSTPEDAAYAEWSDDWEEDENMEAPGWFLIYTDDSAQILYESLGPRYRMLAVGSSPDCEIHSEDRGAEADHAEVQWDEGILVIKDLKTEVGTYVNDNLVEEEEVLRNGDVIGCGDLYIHAVRGTAGSTRERTAGHRAQEADDWAGYLRAHDPNFCFIFSQPTIDGGKEELTIWGDGEARVEITEEGEKSSVDARVHESTIDLVCGALLRAGFPHVPTEKVDDDEQPPELVAFQGDEQANVVLAKRVLSKSEEYRHATELLRTLLVQIA